MLRQLASRIMPRTTFNLDGPVLADLKRLQRKEGKPLGALASELLATAIAERKQAAPVVRFQWIARSMGSLVDLEDDKEALFAALDERDKKNPRQP